jgi:hypothetical protein
MGLVVGAAATAVAMARTSLIARIRSLSQLSRALVAGSSRSPVPTSPTTAGTSYAYCAAPTPLTPSSPAPAGFRDGSPTPPTASASSALRYGVNNLDQAVGPATVAGGQFDNRNRAVLYENGQAIDLNARVVNLPSTVILTTAINDAGVIVGNGCLQPCNPFQPSGTAYMLIPNP